MGGFAPFANEADGWYISSGDLGALGVASLRPGENVLDLVLEERAAWGGVGSL